MPKTIADSCAFTDKLDSLADAVIHGCPNISDLVLVGIQRRGTQLAERLARTIEKNTGAAIPLGVLDITFYRDDLSMVAQQPIVHSTEIRFNLDGKHVVLVDDVIYTGRTIRAALDALVDFGRPRVVRLLVLVDRGLRELPVQPDYAGWQLATTTGDRISVKVTELDGEDSVTLIAREG